MAIILPNSIFYHIGRTGGHWVSHVLWEAGLVQKRLFPLHLTPMQAAGAADFEYRDFRFCFVRHPLHWLASLWRHEMEFGWDPDSLITKLAYSENFEIFLEKMLAAWPDGPCSAQLAPYLSACSFVGKLETLETDLAVALEKAGEIFDRRVLEIPPINETASASIKSAAIASETTLKKVMESERAFNDRFGYTDIPASLVGSPPKNDLWPILPVKIGADLVKAQQSIAFGLTNIRYDYRFENGRLTPKRTVFRREQLELIEALRNSAENMHRVAVLGDGDPYFAYLLKNLGAKEVDFITSSTDVLPQTVIDVVDTDVRFLSYKEFLEEQNLKTAGYDSIVISGLLELTPLIELDLAMIAARLNPSGAMTFAYNAFFVPEPSKLLLQQADDTVCFYSFQYFSILLGVFGFEKTEMVSKYSYSPSADMRSGVTLIAERRGIDPEHLLGRDLITAVMPPKIGTSVADRVRLWFTHGVDSFLFQSIEKQAPDIQADFAKLYMRLDRLQAKDLELKDAVLDRDRALTEARQQVVAARTDLEEAQVRFRKEMVDARTELDLALIEARKNAYEAQTKFEEAEIKFRNDLIDTRLNVDLALTDTRKHLMQAHITIDLLTEQLRRAQNELEEQKSFLKVHSHVDNFITENPARQCTQEKQM